MAYDDDPSTRSLYRSFSPSHICVVRDMLRYDQRVQIGTWQAIHSPYGGKPRLGAVSREFPSNVIDFNGDGKRDIALWKSRATDAFSNTGEFIVRTAPAFTSGFVRRFGRQDDIPVPALYNADNKTDQAVYRPGEVGSGAPDDASSWYWCPSNSSPTPPSCEFGGYGAATFGQRQDIPLPGLKVGGSPTRYLAVYRPSNATFYWRDVAGGRRSPAS